MTVLERSGYIVKEGSFSQDPAGAGELWLPSLTLGALDSQLRPIETMYHNGQPYPTDPIPGVDGGSLDFEVPWLSLAAAIGDGGAVPAADWLTILLECLMGDRVGVVGEGVVSLAGTTLTLDTDAFDLGQLIALSEAALPSASDVRASWVPISVDNTDATYDLAYAPGPAFTGAAIAMGYEQYVPTLSNPNTFSLVYTFNRNVEDTLSGCAIKGFTITMEKGKEVRVAVKLEYDRKTSTSRTITPPTGPASTPVKAVQSAVYINGTAVPSMKTTIEMNPSAEWLDDHGGLHGRGGHQVLFCNPEVRIQPLWSTTHRSWVETPTPLEVIVQIGAGAPPPAGVFGSTAFYFPRMVAMSQSAQAQGNLQREELVLKLANDGTTTPPPLQIFRG